MGYRIAALAVLATLALSACDEPRAPAPSAEPVTEPPEAALPPIDLVGEPAWSPDGRRIVVSWDRGTGARLFGLLPGTPDEPPVPSSGLPLSYGQERHPTWSPDRLWIAYEEGPEAVPAISRMRPDGSDPERLRRFAADPAWSPDGSLIAYVSVVPGDVPRLGLMHRDGQDGPSLDSLPRGAHSDPSWSPDGRRMTLTVRTTPTPAIHVLDRETSEWNRLAAGTRSAWSADGAVVFVERDDSVFAHDVATGEEALIVGGGRHPEPDPTGRRLAVVQGNRYRGTLYLVDLDSGSRVRITQGKEDVGGGVDESDGRRGDRGTGAGGF